MAPRAATTSSIAMTIGGIWATRDTGDTGPTRATNTGTNSITTTSIRYVGFTRSGASVKITAASTTTCAATIMTENLRATEIIWTSMTEATRAATTTKIAGATAADATIGGHRVQQNRHVFWGPP